MLSAAKPLAEREQYNHPSFKHVSLADISDGPGDAVRRLRGSMCHGWRNGDRAYQGPAVLVASRDGRTLYVANADAKTVAWVALPEGEVVRCVAVPNVPTGLALSPDGRRLIVTCAAARSTVLALDARLRRRAGDGLRRTHGLCPGRQSRRQASLRLQSFRQRRISDQPGDHGPKSSVSPRARTDRRGHNARRPHAAGAQSPVEHALRSHVQGRRYTGHHRDRHDTLAAGAIPLQHGANSVRGICVSPDGQRALVRTCCRTSRWCRSASTAAGSTST